MGTEDLCSWLFMLCGKHKLLCHKPVKTQIWPVSSWEGKKTNENADRADTGLFACSQFLQETDVCLVFLVGTVRAAHRGGSLSCGPLGGL